jgi:nicotinate-nucleotide adenylyltransferase
MRIGILGGTFDPVHLGHLLLAEQCREQCELDQVWFLPAGLPPHKQGLTISDGRMRAEMLEFAVAGYPQFVVNRMELKREGASYTFETLSALKSEDPTRELFFLVGADSLAELSTWREPRRILELATVVAVNRGDRPPPDLRPVRDALGAEATRRIQLVTMPGCDFSSTDLRRRVRENRSIRFLVPRAVEAYIAEHGLYRNA